MDAPTEPAPRHENAFNDQFDALLNAAVDGIVLITPKGTVTRFNTAAEQLFGYTEAEVVGRNVSMLMPQPDRRAHDSYLARYHATGEARIIGIGRELTALRKDGSTFPIELSVGEFDSAQAKGFVGILRDITERQQHQEMLRRQAQELRLIFANAPMAFVVTDPGGNLLDVNASCCSLFRSAAGALLETSLIDLIHPEDRADGQHLLDSLLTDGGSVRRALRFLAADGETIDAQMYAAIGRDHLGDPLMVIVALTDRGPLIKATREADELRARLTHVSRLGTLGEMVSGIAHELNQPLSAIVNYANASRRLLASGMADDKELGDILSRIAQQGDRAGQVIRGLRALLRKRDEVRESFDCSDLVREVVQICEFEIRQGGYRLLLNLAQNLPPVLGDRIQIQQVVLNLIRNALDAMQEHHIGDRIDIVTRHEGDMVSILVSDNGPGISGDIAENIGSPFFTTKADGLGLGLSICHSILSAHEGRMDFKPNADTGVTFEMVLPAMTTEEQP